MSSASEKKQRLRHVEHQQFTRHCTMSVIIGVDLAGILRRTHGERRRWVGAEWCGVWWGCPLCSRLGGLGERLELPQRGPGQIPGRKRMLAILKPQNAPFCIYMTKI